jgi:multidrug efflux pump subunit AcrA (membrane-fusion protein)
MTKFTFFLFLLSICCLQSCKPKYNSIKPLRKDITQAIYASGKLYPKQRRILSSKIAGYVQQIYVKAGDSVLAGMPIIAIRSEVPDLNIQTAQNNMELAGNNTSSSSAALQLAQEDILAAQSKYALDSTNYLRFQNLFQQNATSKLLLEQAKTQAEIAKQNLQKAKLVLQNLQQKANAEYQNAKNIYATQKAVKGEFVLYADANMRIYDIRIKTGELVTPAMPLIEVGHTNLFEVELAIDESDLGLVKVGQKVIFELNSMKNTFLQGELTQVYPSINPLNKTAKVVANIEQNANINLFSGMSIEGNIIVAERKNVLVVPRVFVFEKEYVKNKDKEKIKFRKGIEDLEYVEVLQGIDDKTEIIDAIE